MQGHTIGITPPDPSHLSISIFGFWYDDVLSYFYFEDRREMCAFVPEDLGSEQGVGRQVLREDLLGVHKVLGGLLKLGSSCDAPRQPGRQTCEIRKSSVAGKSTYVVIFAEMTTSSF